MTDEKGQRSLGEQQEAIELGWRDFEEAAVSSGADSEVWLDTLSVLLARHLARETKDRALEWICSLHARELHLRHRIEKAQPPVEVTERDSGAIPPPPRA